jgi:FkbM family methyltransferase
MTFHSAMTQTIIGTAKFAPRASSAALVFLVNRVPIPTGARPFLTRLSNELGCRIPVTATLTTGDHLKVFWNDSVGQDVFYDGCSEPEVMNALRSHLNAGDTFIDVGAHIGQYSLLASRIVGANGTVHAFEPDPSTFELLVENMRSLANVSVNQIALSNEKGSAELFLGDVAHVAFNSLRPLSSCGTGKHCSVATLTLDEYVASRRLAKVALIKMDVEGAEMNVLLGARELLTGLNKPRIVLELNQNALRQFGCSQDMVKDLLREYGYDLFAIDGPLVSGSTRQAAVFNALAVPVTQSAAVAAPRV